MKLTELDNKTRHNASRALKEHYELPFDVNKMSISSTRTMLQKVRGLMTEAKQSSDFYKHQATPAHMKLVFMEQALADHFNELRSRPQPRIVIENEEVEKSQVVLAALVSGIESEIGVNESQTYNDQVSQQLDQLSAALKEAFNGMKTALGTVTGDAGAQAFDAGAELGAEAGMDAGMDAGAELGAEAGMDAAEEIPEPEDAPVSGVGRAKR